VYLAKLGMGSRRTVQQSMASLAAMIAGGETDPRKLRWERLSRADTVNLRSELQERFAPATANKMLSVLRGVLRTARDMGIMSERAFQTAASLESIKQTTQSSLVPVGPKTLEGLFQSCAASPGADGRRDAALLAVFLSSGLRRSEASALDMADYDAKTGLLHIRGERPEYDRLVTLPKPGRKAVEDWLSIRSTEPGPLFLPVDRGGLIRFRRMTAQAIYSIFRRIAARTETPEITLRDLRRAYVTSLIREGKSIEEVRYLVGHASWFTTAAYRSLAEDMSVEVYSLDKLPYRAHKGGKR